MKKEIVSPPLLSLTKLTALFRDGNDQRLREDSLRPVIHFANSFRYFCMIGLLATTVTEIWITYTGQFYRYWHFRLLRLPETGQYPRIFIFIILWTAMWNVIVTSDVYVHQTLLWNILYFPQRKARYINCKTQWDEKKFIWEISGWVFLTEISLYQLVKMH